MKFISVRSTLIFIVCAGIAISSPAQSGAALPLPPDSVRERVASRTQIQLRLTLDKAIYSAQNHSIAAMVAKYTFLSSYWSFRSYQASRLPSLNLSGEVLSFDRSLRLLQDYDTGEMRYLENYNLQNTLGLAIQQNITLTGGTSGFTRRSTASTSSPPRSLNPIIHSPSRFPTPSRSLPTTASNGIRRSPRKSTNWPNAPTSKPWRTSRCRP